MTAFNSVSSVSDGFEVASVRRARRRMWLWAAGALGVFLALSIGFSFTRAPWWDEGMFADVALNFRRHAHFGSSILDPNGYLHWPEVNRYTYWQFPAYLLALGVWLHLVPFSIVWIRLFSVLWGSLYIYCWFVLVRSLSRNESLALFVASVVALDYATVAAASNGRMDMMCAALGQAAVASFLYWKESHWNRAVFVAGCFAAASLFCHPMGAIASAAPQIFLAQTRAASSYRVTGFLSVLRNIADDLYWRYVGMYYLNLSGIDKLKAASLVFAVVGALALATNRRLRLQPVGRALLILALIGYLGVAVIDNQKFPIYFVYSMPPMAACGAFWVYDRWRSGGIGRFFPAALLACSILATVGGFSYKIDQDDFSRLYRPAIAAVKADLPPGGLIMGGSELGFVFGFGPGLIDDRYLGYVSGKRPDVYVENGYYGLAGEPGRVAYTLLHSQYHLTFQNSAYKVYVRNRVEPSSHATK